MCSKELKKGKKVRSRITISAFYSPFATLEGSELQPKKAHTIEQNESRKSSGVHLPYTLLYSSVYSILRNKIYDFYRAVGESSLPNNAIGSFRSTKPELKLSY